jgi:hypothetical protein
VNGLSAAERPAGANVIEQFADNGLIAVFETTRSCAVVVALIAAGNALWRGAGAPLGAPILLALAAVPMAFPVPPFGQVGLAVFIAAVVLVVRTRSVPVTPTPAMRPSAA